MAANLNLEEVGSCLSTPVSVLPHLFTLCVIYTYFVSIAVLSAR